MTTSTRPVGWYVGKIEDSIVIDADWQGQEHEMITNLFKDTLIRMVCCPGESDKYGRCLSTPETEQIFEKMTVCAIQLFDMMVEALQRRIRHRKLLDVIAIVCMSIAIKLESAYDIVQPYLVFKWLEFKTNLYSYTFRKYSVLTDIELDILARTDYKGCEAMLIRADPSPASSEKVEEATSPSLPSSISNEIDDKAKTDNKTTSLSPVKKKKEKKH